LYFAVNALSPAGLQRVELIINDKVVASEDARGEKEYNLVFGWQSEVNGDYRIQARATDSTGTVMQSVVVVQPVRGGVDAAGSGIAAIPEIGSIVSVPEGTFRMGSDDGPDEEKPVHDVHVSGFQIDPFPVTVGQFRAYIAQSKYKTSAETANEPITRTWHFDDDPNRWEHPVRFVSWFDADTYCRAQGMLLPTEAQWEYAARGTDFRRYPWGNDFDPARVPAGDTSPVGFFTSGVSPFGVYDMSGNVWEWTDDWFDPLYYRASDLNNPRSPKKIDQKSIRGGGFNSSPSDLRVTRRIHNFQSTYHADVGFRCVK
jgi:sulfatase modifying factor 1